MKLALLYAFRDSEWKSCVSITQNIKHSYEALDHELKSFDYDHLKGELHLEDLADELKEFSPDKIVFIDHRPTPKQLLARLVKRDLNVPLIIHLYGDFSVYCNDWLEQESLLKNFKVKFITASTKQQKLVSQFINSSEDIVHRVPFSVNTETFIYEEDKVEQFYNDYKLDKSKIHFIYAGRITTQKNIIDLANIFKRMIDRYKNEMTLLIAGDVDDMGEPFHGNYLAPGTTQLQLSKSLSPHIKWIGSLSSKELAVAYSACDAFVSLSTFHDEDFGMAPLEAACTGTSIILTSWGGYTDFIDKLKNTKSVKVSLNENYRYSFDQQQVTQLLLEQKKITAEDRTAQIKTVNKQFSIKEISQQTDLLIKKEDNYFPGFNHSFWKFTNCFRTSPDAPFKTLGDNNDIQKVYTEAYNAYSL
tara:strand:- start:916 stop:2166 length:1251 start_codon:yes stop_codon:yes gene_type:complete